MSRHLKNEALRAEPWYEPVSRPIDVHRWSDYPELRQCLADLMAEIEATEGRARRRNEASEKRFRDAIRSLVLDLYVSWIADPASTVGVALGKDRFRPGDRYRALFLTYDTFAAAFHGLNQLGYLQIVQKGYNYGRAQVTRVRATEKLIDILTVSARLNTAKVAYRLAEGAPEPIILRDKQKKRISYTDTIYTTTIRYELTRINDWLAEHHIDMLITDEQTVELNARMSADFRDESRKRSSIDYTAKRLRRIFNEDWEHGGRFYGGWWQNVPKEYRRYITIDDKRTVELDYSGMHVLMMYAELGAEIGDADAYDIGLPDVPRNIVKREFNKLVNARNRMKQEPNLARYGVTSEQLHDHIREKHKPIAQFFKSGHGSRLQNLDADLAARVLIRFLDMRYVCLPVHDSFIVHHRLEDELKHVMATEFKQMFGVDPSTNAKHRIELPPKAGLVSMDIDDILSPSGEYAGYQTRLHNWRVARDNLSGR